MGDLQIRAKKFLERPYPLGNYAADNLTDSLIRRYIDGGPWDDPELQDLLRLCLFTAEAEADEHRGEAKAYFRECTEVLRGILLEVFGSCD